MQTLPVGGAVKVFLNFGALRDAALLDVIAGPRTVEDADYRRFAEEIGFDYRTDLDAVAAVFVGGNFYAAARGHFNWKRLADYTRRQKGQCDNGICTLPGGQPDRFVSFYELSPQVLALAVSARPDGVDAIGPPSGKVAVTVPPAAVWISVPGADFKGLSLPAGMQSFVAPLAQAEETAFSIQPASPPASGTPSHPNASFQIRMDVACVSPDAAAAMAHVFTSITDLLRTMIVKQGVGPRNPPTLPRSSSPAASKPTSRMSPASGRSTAA